MDSIDFLEHAYGSLTIRYTAADGDQVMITLDDPREMHFQAVLGYLQVEGAPGTPGDIPLWQRALVFDRWRAAFDLPPFQDAQRLAYLVDHYRAAISSDIARYTNHDLTALWRARRWTLLLDVLDRLPGHSWYAATVANDPEHAKMVAESMAARAKGDTETEDRGPSLTSWSPEVAMLTNVYDAIRRVEYAVIAVQAGKKAGEPPTPSKRPVTEYEAALELATKERKKKVHDDLVRRLLPHKV